ncbi:MAG: A/G-specific adenine glycosylase [Eubacteriales bacterium]
MTCIDQFRKNLLAWYKKEGRDLPWRKDPTPYKVLISELMLQQTRVDTVIPYFVRFIDEIPDLQALSAAEDERLLKLWQGLGYYSRALRLKKAAQIIIEQFGGQVPDNTEELRSLPGIGAYTAGAVASIAYGIPVPAVDGNVLRIAARLTAGSLKAKKQTEEFIRTLISPESAGDFNQALMDLGAGVCLPGEPKCAECPVSECCDAYRLGIVSEIPVNGIKKVRKIENKTVLIVSANSRFALRKRKDSGLLANLWEFPNIDGTLTGKACVNYLNTLGLTVKELIKLKPAKHIFTHLEWHMTGYFVLSEWTQNPSDWIWATKEEISLQYSIPTAFKSYILFCCNENN